MLTTLLLMAALAGDDAAADEAIQRFKEGMKAPSGAARAAAVAELARTPHEKTFKLVAPIMTSGEASLVRAAAAKGLGGFADYKKLALPALQGALNAGPNAKDGDVQGAILESIGKLGDETVLPLVHKHCEDKDPKVAKAALQAASDIRRIASIDFIINLMKSLEKYTEEQNNGGGGYGNPVSLPGGGDDANRTRAREVIPACIKALKAITKEGWTTSKEWQIWWGKKKGSFKLEN
jgi:HEAT repeat protein